MSSLTKTFDMFFADWTEEYAAEEQSFMRSELIAVDTAIKANDWKTLDKLGYATYSYRDTMSVGPQDENAVLTSRQFNKEKYDSLKANLSLSPKQLADQMNEAGNR